MRASRSRAEVERGDGTTSVAEKGYSAVCDRQRWNRIHPHRFDTATEIGLLGISAAQGARGLPVSSLLVFPALFTAGMSLVDTTDGVLMVGAYGWAFTKPIRKLYYNLTITLVSVIIALAIGGIEVLGLIKDKLDLKGGIWSLVGIANENSGVLGYFIIAIFITCWLLLAAFYRIKRLDEVGAL